MKMNKVNVFLTLTLFGCGMNVNGAGMFDDYKHQQQHERLNSLYQPHDFSSGNRVIQDAIEQANEVKRNRIKNRWMNDESGSKGSNSGYYNTFQY